MTLLRAGEVATLLRVSKRTVLRNRYRWFSGRGYLGPVRVGNKVLIHREDVERFARHGE